MLPITRQVSVLRILLMKKATINQAVFLVLQLNTNEIDTAPLVLKTGRVAKKLILIKTCEIGWRYYPVIWEKFYLMFCHHFVVYKDEYENPIIIFSLQWNQFVSIFFAADFISIVLLAADTSDEMSLITPVIDVSLKKISTMDY